MAKDMSFGAKGRDDESSMSQEHGFDFSDLYQNEESIDISKYMTSANLELCDDDLFQSLFPTDAEVVKSEKPDPFESELDWWAEPGSAYSSACSSAAQSPVQFFTTPPVTPKPDRVNPAPPELLRQQLQQDRLSQISMSRTQLTPFTISEESPNLTPFVNEKVTVKNEPDEPQGTNLGVYYLKNEQDVNNNMSTTTGVKTIICEIPAGNLQNGVKDFHQQSPKLQQMLKRPAGDDDGSKQGMKRSKLLNKDSEEYKMKRERNNVAVRKSRDKAKQKSLETQNKVTELSNENKRLQDRVAELTHELNTLKGILKSLPQQQRMSL